METLDRQGLPIRVTGLERTLVDVLDRPALAGGWEEAWRSWEGVAVAPRLRAAPALRPPAGDAPRPPQSSAMPWRAGRERLAVPSAVLDELRSSGSRVSPILPSGDYAAGTRLMSAPGTCSSRPPPRTNPPYGRENGIKNGTWHTRRELGSRREGDSQGICQAICWGKPRCHRRGRWEYEAVP